MSVQQAEQEEPPDSVLWVEFAQIWLITFVRRKTQNWKDDTAENYAGLA